MSNEKSFVLVLVSILCLFRCPKAQTSNPVRQNEKKSNTIAKIKNDAKVIHVLVALCDNVNQGIVPVPAFLGIGADTQKNLYWGAAFGVKTFFSKSPNWTKVSETNNPKENVLQRIIFKHNSSQSSRKMRNQATFILEKSQKLCKNYENNHFRFFSESLSYFCNQCPKTNG